MLTSHPIVYDKDCLSSLVRPEKFAAELDAIFSSMRRHKDAGPFVGMFAALFLGGKASKKGFPVPVSDAIPALEVLSVRPEEDANRLMSNLPKTLSSRLILERSDAPDFDEILVILEGRRLLSFIRCDDSCDSKVHGGARNDVHLGSVDTVLSYLYKRLLLGGSPNDENFQKSLRCFIGCMYETQFDMSEHKRTKIMKRFVIGDCYGPGPRPSKRKGVPFVYRPYLQENRDVRKTFVSKKKGK